MKNFYLVCATMIAGLSMSSCSQDDEVVETSVRDTQTDMEILSRFIDINESTNEYYINGNKKTRALSYVTNSDLKELEEVSPVSLEKCQMELNELNAQVAQAMANPEIAYIVLSVEGKTIVKNVRKADFEFKLDNDNVNSTSSRAIPSSLMVYGGSTQTTNEFLDATRTIRMSVTKDFSVSGYYYFTVNSKDAKVSPDDNTTTPETVVFSGTGSLWNTSFTWTAYWDAQQDNGQFKWEFKATGITPSYGTIATLKFSK